MTISSWSQATHIIGGEIYYDRLGNGDYRVTLEVYRDCFNGVADFDNPLQFTVFNTDGSIFGVYDFNLISDDELPYVSTSACIIPPSDFCVQLGFYSNIINLPDSPTGYIIAYSRCCWSNNILNILNPGDNGITITSFIPPTAIVNSNPRYVNYPPLILCANQTLEFDHMAEDPDGDSLVYSIVTPFSGGDGVNPVPDPEPTPPFPFNTFETGFSVTQPFGANSTVQIDPVTGLLTFIPNLLGNFVLAVEVSEYRNGVLISTKSRTFGYRVVTCEVIPPVEVDIVGTLDQIESCNLSSFIITRSKADSNMLININVNGTALNGLDFSLIPNQITMPIGVFSDTIQLVSLYDSIQEGDETVEIEIIITNTCDPTDKDTTIASLIIGDYTDLTNSYIDYIEVCDEEWNQYVYSVLVENGLPPYTFNWNDNDFPNSTSISIQQSDFVPQDNILNLVVTDNCNKSITFNPINLFNQCPLVVPNIITTNMDGTNEFFIVKNLEDFDQVELIVLNRWGNVVYENLNYTNNWNGIDQKGNYLNDGVYFYKVIPHDDKYEYNEKEKLKFTIHGFLTIVNEAK